MAEENKPETGFSAEYVKSIREEAAAYRVKAKEATDKLSDLEKTVSQSKTTGTINDEFTKRGIKANPTWVTLEEGQSPEKAVDKFLKSYPQFGAEQPQKIVGKTPMSPPKTNSNLERSTVSELGAIKNDPVARAQLRDKYRGLLANQANTNYTI